LTLAGSEQPLLMAIRQEQGIVFLALSTGEVFELAPESVPDRLPPVGEGLDFSLMAEIQEAAERKKIARRLFSLLDRRLQSVAKTRGKLLEDGFTAEGIDAVLEQTAARGLYSDRTYAEAWCRNCLLTRSVGRFYLVSKLRGQHVPGPVAAAAADTVLDSEQESELARTAARTKWRRTNGPDVRKNEAKVIRFLQGRGFSLGQAISAARATKPGHEPTEEVQE
jgi:SOS response regulatory protein OraA/RecX